MKLSQIQEDKKKLLEGIGAKDGKSVSASPSKIGDNKTVAGQPKKDLKDNKDGKKEEEKKEENNDDFENNRTQKLMNSKDNNRKIVVIQFSFIAAIFIAYFVADFILEINLVNDIKKSFKHLLLVSRRPAIIKYTLLFTIEQIANATIQMQNSLVFTQGTQIDVREYYTNYIYDNERDIFQSMTESYPKNFAEYESSFESYNYDDLCLKYYKIKNPTLFDSNFYYLNVV